MLRVLKRILAGGTLTLSMLATPVSASNLLLDITGPLGSPVGIGDAWVYNTAAATFTANQEVANASISFTIGCFSCAGKVFLFDVEPSNTVSSGALKAVQIFDAVAGGTNFAYSIDDFASGLTLTAGKTYSLYLEITAGDAAWYATSTPSFDDTYITPEDSLISRDGGGANVAEYDYQTIQSAGGNPWMYQIYGNVAAATPSPAPVPLPAGMPLMLAGFTGLALFRRRRG
jgi:hypothetical protein